MKYELGNFQELEAKEMITPDAINDIVSRINNTAFSFYYKDELNLFIQNHQQALSNFKSDNRNADAADKILHFLEMRFPDNIDNALFISDTSKQKLNEKFKDQMLYLQRVLPNILSGKLFEIIKTFLNLLTEAKITIHQYSYLKKFYVKLVDQVKENQSIREQTIIELLIYENFNHPRFYNYIINSIKSELNGEDYKTDLIQILRENKKEYDQYFTADQKGFETSLPSLQQQIIHWLETEIKYCKYELKREVKNQVRFEFKTKNKIKTAASVPQLSYILKIFKETGFITNNVQNEIFRTISECVETEKAETISVKSLSNNFHDQNDVTKEQVKKIFVKALEAIR